MPASYGAVLVLWYAYYGVLFSFSLGLVFLALLPATLLLGRTAQFVKELSPFIVLLMSYEALQGVAGSLALAPVECGLNSLNETIRDPRTCWMNTLAPSAPPWYNGVASNVLATTSAQIGSSNLFSELARIGSLIESDKLAAFPSLHAAYVVLFSYFTIRLKRTYGLVSIPITIGVLFSTIYLGQHYITDLVAGVVVVASCVIIVTRMDRKGKTSHLVSPTGKL
jgi:membrane-associated phospholipid phosphatase